VNAGTRKYDTTGDKRRSMPWKVRSGQPVPQGVSKARIGSFIPKTLRRGFLLGNFVPLLNLTITRSECSHKSTNQEV